MQTERYIIDFNSEDMKKDYYDVVIIGSGIAGIYTSLLIPDKYSVLVLTKEELEISNSSLAQGGIAAPLSEGDSPKLHFEDTINAGAGLCDEESVWVLVNEAKKNIQKLLDFDVKFDMENKKDLKFSREAAHSKDRIIHSGDTTGKVVLDQLLIHASKRKNLTLSEKKMAVEIITEKEKAKAVVVLDEKNNTKSLAISPMIISATGGFGRLYPNTSNPEVATGDGLAMAYRAGAKVIDLEFVQFHPTVLAHEDNKSFLISEAVRGEGGILRNIHGQEFMDKYHENKELAPRDVVSRAIFSEMKKTRASYVYLDITFKDEKYIKKRFPNIYKTCLEYDIDITKDFIPVAPAEHYCMGGIKTDIYGRTNIEGFYACGEVACTRIHGANRLASNSLLEGLVFGARIAKEIKDVLSNNKDYKKWQIKDSYFGKTTTKRIDVDFVSEDLRKLMKHYVGIIRNKEGLTYADSVMVEYMELMKNKKNESVKDIELQNMILIAHLVILAAIKREESRGAHYRDDFPNKDDKDFNKHIILERS